MRRFAHPPDGRHDRVKLNAHFCAFSRGPRHRRPAAHIWPTAPVLRPPGMLRPDAPRGRCRPACRALALAAMTDVLAQRTIEEFGPDTGPKVVALAELLMQDQAPSATLGEAAPLMSAPARSGPRRRVIPIPRSEACAAAGTASDAFNAKIIRETVSACSTLDNPDLPEVVAETLAGLKDIAPANAREAMLAAQLLATHAATMDSLALARSALSGPLRDAHLGHAARLSHAHAALSEALDRSRGGRRVIVLEYRRTERKSRLKR